MTTANWVQLGCTLLLFCLGALVRLVWLLAELNAWQKTNGARLETTITKVEGMDTALHVVQITQAHDAGAKEAEAKAGARK